MQKSVPRQLIVSFLFTLGVFFNQSFVNHSAHAQPAATLLSEFPGFHGIACNDGKLVCEYQHQGSSFRVLDLESGHIDSYPTDPDQRVLSSYFQLSPDGRTMFVLYAVKNAKSGKHDIHLKSFNLLSGESRLIRTLESGQEKQPYISIFAISPDARFVCYRHPQGLESVVVFDLKDGGSIATLQLRNPEEARAQFDLSGRWLIVRDPGSDRRVSRFLMFDVVELESYKTGASEEFGGADWFIDKAKNKIFVVHFNALYSVSIGKDPGKPKKEFEFGGYSNFLSSTPDGSRFCWKVYNGKDYKFEVYEQNQRDLPIAHINEPEMLRVWDFSTDWSCCVTRDGLLLVHGKGDMFKGTDKNGIQVWGYGEQAAMSPIAFQNEIQRRLMCGKAIDGEFFKSRARAYKTEWERLAKDGDTHAQFLLACCWMLGVDGMQSEKKGMELLKASAAKGNTMAMVYLGTLSYASPAEALGWFKAAADQGSQLGCEYLAGMYRDGIGVEKDHQRALDLSIKAASDAQPFPTALNSIGVSYLYGYGVNKDPVKAVSYFEQAIALGDGDGNYFLGMCLLEGQGVAASSPRAVECFTEGAKCGSNLASLALAFCKATGEGCERDIPGAITMYRRLERRSFGPAKEMADKLEKISTYADQLRREAFIESLGAMVQPLPSVASERGEAIRNMRLGEARMSAWEAQRDWRAHVGGNLGAMGIIPVAIPGPPPGGN